MNLTKMLAELRRERKLIDEAIASLDRWASSGVRPRRGRPPGRLKAYKRRVRPRSKLRQTPGATSLVSPPENTGNFESAARAH